MPLSTQNRNSGGGGGSHSTTDSGKILSENALIKGLKKFPASKWHPLGVQLNIPPDSTLKTIEHNYMHAGGVERCLSETLIRWFKINKTSASWGEICAALRAVQEEVLAKEVARDHGCSPAIVRHPESKYVDLGEKDVTFRCEATGTPPLEYSWKFNENVLKGKIKNTLTIHEVDRKRAGSYQCCVTNKFDVITSNPAELRIGKKVTEDSMYNLLKRSGIQDADWLVIAKQLELTTGTLAGAFLEAWKDSDSVGPSWLKLAKALAKISEGGGRYAHASQQAERNAGCELTVTTMCSTFKEVQLEEPNWHAVSKELGLDLYGHVSPEELYQVWCKHSPSWKKLSRALENFKEYKQVAEQAKKKAGKVLNSDNICWALTEARIEFPDWGRIGKVLGLSLKGRITASLFIEEWRNHGPEMSWERLAQSLKGIGGFELAAEKAMQKTGQVFNKSTMCTALKNAGIQMPDWDKIGKELSVNVQPVSASTFFESWRAYAQDCQPTWTQFAQALESTGNPKDKNAALQARAREGQKMTKGDVCAVLYNAGIQSPDLEKITKLLVLDAAILSSAFFTQWRVLAHDRKPSWKALATLLENQKYTQAAINIQQMKAEHELTEESIQQMLLEANIQKPEWGKIAKGLGFSLQRQSSVNAFLEGWHTFAEPSWENLAIAVGKIREYRSSAENIRSKAGQEFNRDTVCTAFREAGIQLPDWAKIAKQLPVSMQLQISAEEFFDGWFAYTNGYQPSWVKLAQALERTGISVYKQAADKVWKIQGLELGQEAACSILNDYGIQQPDWGKIGKCLGLDSHILPTSFFTMWQVHARNCNPSWERLAHALEATWQYKQTAAKARGKEGNEQLNKETLDKFMHEATLQPDWGKIANTLCFKKYLQGQNTVNSFLEGWHTYAQNSQPSWKLLGWALGNIRDYKSVVKKILGNAGVKLSAETLCELLTETSVHSPDWERIGQQLGLHIKGPISAADFFDAWKAQDFHASWSKLADAIEKVEEYKHAAQNVRDKEVQELNKESMVAIFSEVGVRAPKNWREIGAQLGLSIRGQLSAAMFFKGWSERGSIQKPSWEKLAFALSKINGYWLAADKARGKAPRQLSENNMCELFKDAGDVDWLLISQTLHLTQAWINRDCLRQSLKRWYNNRGNPWSTWRKLAVVVENVYDSEAGQKLRRLAGVALELNAENMGIILQKAGVMDSDWEYIADRLGLTQSSAGRWKRKGMNFFGLGCWTEVLSIWQEEGSHVSWNKLAEAVQEKHGVEGSQIILELSGEGGCPTIVKHPEDTKVAIGRKVHFECQAIGATPLTYSWLHNGIDMPAKHEKKLEFIVLKRSGGEYSCRVENEFGSKKCASAKLTVGDSPRINSIHTDPLGKENIETGGTVSICCTATGESPLKYTWWFTGSAAASHTVLPNEDAPTLVIRAAKENDHQGSYQCQVTNVFGEVPSDSLKIKVGNPPTIEKFGIDGTNKISFRIEEKVNFLCEGKGTPPLRYIWHCNNEVITRRCDDSKLSITAREKTEGEYYCIVKNLFGSKSSEVVRIKVGSLPHVDVHPEIRGTVEPGEFLQLKCEASGKGSLNYVWQHGNQTLVNETRPELIIKHVKEPDQGTYSCRVSNAFGYAMSNPAILKLTITQEELMKELGPHVAARWYMLAVLLNITKPVIDRISKGFTANENVQYSLSEVVETWLEEINATDHKLALKSSLDPSSSNCSEVFKMEASRYWLQIYHVVKRMGYVTFARDLDTKYKLLAESANIHPEYEQTKENEEQQSETKSKPTPVDEDEMHRRFTALINKVQPLLATPDTDPTESCSTSESATDTSVSECQAYLHLIEFPPEETERIADLPSLFKLLTPYLNFQRFHIFEMIIGQFKSARAKEKTQKYREEQLNVYQAHVKLGRFALACEKQNPAVNPPFMRPFSLQLESKWATCTVQDLERLLTCLLPKSIGYTFVWFCKAYQVADDNSICLEYIVSPSVVDILTEEAEKKRGILRSAGILSLHIDGTPFRPKDVIGDEKVETFLKKLETVLPHGRLFQREPLPVSEADTVRGLDSKPSDCPTEEVEEIPPEKSDIEKLQESLQERDEREAALKQSLEQAGIEIENHRSELERVKKDLQDVQRKLRDKCNDIQKLQTVVNQHKSELEKTPLSTLDQASKDLKQKLIDEGSKRAESQQYTMRQLGRVQTNLKSEVKTHIQAQIPELQCQMKEMLDATVHQLRDEMERKLSDMRSSVLTQHEEREERHLRRNDSTAEDQRRRIEKCCDEISQLLIEIVREVQENGGRDKP